MTIRILVIILVLSGCNMKARNNTQKNDEKFRNTSTNNDSLVMEKNNAKINSGLNAPLVCTLKGAKLIERKETLQKVIFSKIKKLEEVDSGFILFFNYDETFLMKMTDYVIAENNCCPFFTFEIKIHGKSDAVLTISGSPEAKKMLEILLTSS